MTRHHRRPLLGSAALLLVLTLASTCAAVADDGDPPTRVARLAYVEGSVSLQPGGTDQWVDAPVNRPLTTGDAVWSDVNSRVELQLDGSLMRLSSRTSIAFLNVADHITQIQLSSGTMIVRVRRLDDDETYEIDTPNLALSLLAPGLYRVSVDDSGTATTVAVRSGQGQVTGGGADFPVEAGQQVVFTGTDTLNANAQQYGAGASPFDVWSTNRDARWDNSVSASYVSSDVVGYTDLDDQGDWSSTPDYGYVWFPRRVQPDWAPYHFGHWAYIAPWGYTWVDDQPWGFAPFHYGRWISRNGAWGWVPCPPRSRDGGGYVRPVYAPALVAWIGAGAGVAWFALGPREVYVPSYPVSRAYVNNINVSNTIVNRTVVNNIYNTTIINNRSANTSNITYVNRGVRGAIAATTTQAFTSAQPVATHAVQFDPRAGRVQAFAPAAMPTRQAVLGLGRQGPRPPAALETRAVVARTAPPPPPPSFERRQQAIQQNGGRPLSIAAVRQIQPQAAQRSAPIRIIAPAPAQGNNRAGTGFDIRRNGGPPGPQPANNTPAGNSPPRATDIGNAAVQQQQQLRQEAVPQRQQQDRALQQQRAQEQQQQLRQQADQQRQQQDRALQQQRVQEQQQIEQQRQQQEQQRQQQVQALQQQRAQEQVQRQPQQQQQRPPQETPARPPVRREDKPAKPTDPPN